MIELSSQNYILMHKREATLLKSHTAHSTHETKIQLQQIRL